MEKEFIKVKKNINWTYEDELNLFMLIVGMIPLLNIFMLIMTIKDYIDQRETVYIRKK